jgi:glutamate dehydrogenase (NAD(P)+)
MPYDSSPSLISIKDTGRSVADYPDGEKLAVDAVIDVECQIWIPAARPDVIRKDNVARLKTKLAPQAANIPFTPEAERILHENGILVIPDFIANARRRYLRLGRIPRRHANSGLPDYRRKNPHEY